MHSALRLHDALAGKLGNYMHLDMKLEYCNNTKLYDLMEKQQVQENKEPVALGDSLRFMKDFKAHSLRVLSRKQVRICARPSSHHARSSAVHTYSPRTGAL